MNPNCNVEPHVVARWESRGGKYWCELYRGPYGYGYRARDAGGHLGLLDLSDALRVVESRLPDMQADANVTAMRLTFRNF